MHNPTPVDAARDRSCCPCGPAPHRILAYGGDSCLERRRSAAISSSERASGEPAFTVDLDGFEGPLDLLLELARRQKVDLARISVLALAEQYLAVRRGRAQAEARTRGRLPGHGGLARLPEVEALAARRRRRRPSPTPRNSPRRLPSGFAASRRSARRPGCCSTARASGATSSAAASRKRSRFSGARTGTRTSTICSRPTPARRRSTRAPGSASRRAKCGRSPRRARRWRASSA